MVAARLRSVLSFNHSRFLLSSAHAFFRLAPVVSCGDWLQDGLHVFPWFVSPFLLLLDVLPLFFFLYFVFRNLRPHLLQVVHEELLASVQRGPHCSRRLLLDQLLGYFHLCENLILIFGLSTC